MSAAGQLSLVGLVKSFGEELAVDHLDLDIAAGEFFSLLGSSGCGKTTTLRMIAGFEHPDAGSIHLDGRDMSQVAPHKRPVNTVFQSYALFPFMSVRDNVEFGLRYHEVDKADARRRVDEALELVEMGSMANRKPRQLSGGQQQRVALARALVLRPTVLLLDEPMGALDAKLRKQLQIELRSLQRLVGTTFVYVTHDQEEALTMSDRLAVLHQGKVMQVGSPSEVYSRPTHAYVASFLGTANLYDATVLTTSTEALTCRCGGVSLRVAAPDTMPTGSVSLVVRPERVELECPDEVPRAQSGNELMGRVEQLAFKGAHTQATVMISGLKLLAEVANVHGEVPEWLCEGGEVRVRISETAIRVLPQQAPTDPAGELSTPADAAVSTG